MRKVRRSKRRQAELLTDDQDEILRWGKPFDAYALHFASDEEMLRAWERHRERILADWRSYRPDGKPWGWWRFDSPEPRDERIPETEQLRRLGLL